MGEIPEQRGGDGIILNDGMPMCAPCDSYDIECVIGYDALYESMEKCARGVMWKDSVAKFVLRAPESVMRLCDDLHRGTYRPHPLTRFVVTSPKRRTIVGVPFRDRVVQRSYNDNVIFPCMSRSWIYDNYACQEDKGTSFARDRMKCHMQREYRKSGDMGYALSIDVTGYYDNMIHDVMFESFRRKCPDWAADFACQTISSQYHGAKGVSPGSQLVQIAGVDYLSPVDHFIKESLGVKGYGRYMDDMVLIHQDRSFLESCIDLVSERIAMVGLAPHPAKTRLRKLSDGFPFLGFDFRITRNGKALMTLRPESVKRMRRHIKSLHNAEIHGMCPEGATLQSYMSWRAHASMGDSRALIEKCDKWFEELIGGSNG